jgi:recombination protein RecA
MTWKKLGEYATAIDICVRGRVKMEKKEEIRFLTGCDVIDLVVGGAKGKMGFPAGKIVNIVGDKSTGKTLLCMETLATNYYKYIDKFKWLYIDAERGNTFDSDSLYGFQIMPDEDFEPATTIEMAFYQVTKFTETVKKNQFGIVVLDSLDSLVSAEQDERAEERIKAYDNGKAFDKGSYGMAKQKYLSQEFFPQLASVLQDKNILLIIVSQVRDNIDSFSFEKYTRSGGKALDFYCYCVLWLMNMKKDVKKARPVGYTVKVKTTKLKAPRPFREGVFSLLFDYGIDSIGSGVDFLFDTRTPQGELSATAKSLSWGGGDEKLGVNPIKALLKENNLMDAFLQSKFSDGKVTVDSGFEFFDSKPEYKVLWDKKFGSSMSRAELIRYIEDNSLQDELRRRVIEKWESIEESIKSDRRPKYGTIPIPQEKE